jgi:hypothetical protein
MAQRLGESWLVTCSAHPHTASSTLQKLCKSSDGRRALSDAPERRTVPRKLQAQPICCPCAAMHLHPPESLQSQHRFPVHTREVLTTLLCVSLCCLSPLLECVLAAMRVGRPVVCSCNLPQNSETLQVGTYGLGHCHWQPILVVPLTEPLKRGYAEYMQPGPLLNHGS